MLSSRCQCILELDERSINHPEQSDATLREIKYQGWVRKTSGLTVIIETGISKMNYNNISIKHADNCIKRR